MSYELLSLLLSLLLLLLLLQLTNLLVLNYNLRNINLLESIYNDSL